MSWRVIGLPNWINNYFTVVDENLTYYAISDVSAAESKYEMIKCDLQTGMCTLHDTGVPVPDYDWRYNIRDLFVEGDYVYGCWSYESRLNCYRFNRHTGEGSFYGDVAPGGHDDISYHHSVKIKEDVQYFWAMTGRGTEWKLWRFGGSPSQILDPALWEEVGYISRDPDSPATCVGNKINYSYCSGLVVYERYIIIPCIQRCPPGNVGNFAIFIFDTIKEKLYNSNFEEIPFGLSTIHPDVKITVENPPEIQLGSNIEYIVVDMERRKAYVAQDWYNQYGLDLMCGITKVDMVTRRAEFVSLQSCYWAVDLGLAGVTVDGKLLLFARDWHIDDHIRLKLFDPDTTAISDILDLGRYAFEADSEKTYHTMLSTEDVYLPIPSIYNTLKHIVLPPGWEEGLKLPKRIHVESPEPEKLSIRAEFLRAPSNVKIKIWRVPDFTIQYEESLAGATSIDRTYSVSAGRYRVEVVA